MVDRLLFVIGFFGGLLIIGGFALQSAEILVFMAGFLVAFVASSWVMAKGNDNAGDHTSNNRDGGRVDFGGEHIG